MKDRIYYTAVEFLAQHPSQGKIAVNDMALPFGGIFDINQNWGPLHSQHSRGKAVDVRGNGALYSIPSNLQPEFTDTCDDKGAVESIIRGSGSNRHIHCRWP